MYTNNTKDAQFKRATEYTLYGYIQHKTNGRVSKIVHISPEDYIGSKDCRNVKFLMTSVGYFDKDLNFIKTPSPQWNDAHIKWWDPIQFIDLELL